MALPLDNLLVHEAATTVAGQLFGRLLAEQGADVAMLRAPRDGFAERFLARKKRTGWQDAQAPHIVIVDGNPSNLPSDLSEETIRARWPGASYVSITPYGRTGTWANVPGDDATADALSGTMSLRGTGTGGPNAAAPHVVQQAGAYAAYVAVMQHLLRSGPDSPAVIDVSLAETALLFAEMHASYVEYLGVVPQRRLLEVMSLFGMVRTSDGWIMAHNWGEPGWIAANALMEGAGLTDDIANQRLTDLSRRDREIRASVAPWFAARKKWDVTREAQALRLHWGASATIEDLMDDPHVAESEALEEVAAGDGKTVRLPRLALRPVAVEGPGEAMERRPLRVLDLTHYWAGPACARMLADFGMDVIKIEPPQKPDPVRLQMPLDNVTQPFGLERGWWNGLNVGKRSLSLDIKTPAGKAVFLKLVAESDVVLENFSATAMMHWGLGWETLREANPNLVYVSMSAFGSRGPYSSYIAFGSNMEPIAGVPELVGDADGPPMLVPSSTPDTFGAFVGAASVLTGLMARKAGGAGMWIELSQHQALLGLIAWAFDHYQVTGEVPPRSAIHADGHAYRAVLRCSGENDWLVVSIADDAQLLAARERIGAAPRSPDSDAFERWAAGQSAESCARNLRDLGIAAMPVLDIEEGFRHPVYAERKALRTFETAAGFERLGMTAPFLIDGDRPLGPPKTPLFGSSTRSVLAEIGKLPDSAIDELLAHGDAADHVVVDWQPGALTIDQWLEVGAVKPARLPRVGV